MRIFNNKCMELGVMLENWKIVCIIPVCKNRGDRSDCGNYRGISLIFLGRYMVGD